jgi:GR25 family glycosyltransferase involved in LPS biosynthesis
MKIFPAVINLKSRPDRLQSIKSSLPDKLFDHKIHYHVVDKHPNGGSYGCYSSHLEIYKMAIKNGYKFAFVFEDDMKLDNIKYDERVLIDILKSTPIDILRINHRAIIKKKNYSHHIDKTHQMGCNSYIISRKFMKKMCRYGVQPIYNKEIYCHIDAFIPQISANMFTTKMPMAIELPFKSDNSNWNENSTGLSAFALAVFQYSQEYSTVPEKLWTLFLQYVNYTNKNIFPHNL